MPRTKTKAVKNVAKRKDAPIVKALKAELKAGVFIIPAIGDFTTFTKSELAAARRSPLVVLDDTSFDDRPYGSKAPSRDMHFGIVTPTTTKYFLLLDESGEKHVVTTAQLKTAKRHTKASIRFGSSTSINTSGYSVIIYPESRKLAVGCRNYTFDGWASSGFIDSQITAHYGADSRSYIKRLRSDLKALVAFLIRRFPNPEHSKSDIDILVRNVLTPYVIVAPKKDDGWDEDEDDLWDTLDDDDDEEE